MSFHLDDYVVFVGNDPDITKGTKGVILDINNHHLTVRWIPNSDQKLFTKTVLDEIVQDDIKYSVETDGCRADIRGGTINVLKLSTGDRNILYYKGFEAVINFYAEDCSLVCKVLDFKRNGQPILFEIEEPSTAQETFEQFIDQMLLEDGIETTRFDKKNPHRSPCFGEI